MGMRFSYVPFSGRQAIWPLGGRHDRPRPVINVSIVGPADTRVREAALDTGADDTVFPEDLAQDLGIDLTNAPTGGGSGGGRIPFVLRYAEVLLRISDGHEFREWTACVGFTAIPLKRALLGFAGFLQFFTATFHGDLEQVELAVNTQYRGT